MIITTVSGASTASGSPVNGILLAIHAGAGDRSKDGSAQRTAQAERDLRRALDAGYALLEQGAPAEDAVCAAIHVMEDAPEFNAGRGAALTSEGKVSMDACLMTGDGEVGSAAGLTTARHPIDVARAVKERAKHTMFALPGEDLLRSWGIELRDPSYFVTEERRRSLARAQSEGDAWEKHGTIGAVARMPPDMWRRGRPRAASRTRCRGASGIRRCPDAARTRPMTASPCHARVSARRS